LGQQRFTVVDVETTGRYAWESRITELSVLQATLAGGVIHQQTTLLNPQVQIPAKIVRFTGITQQMVDAAPLATEVLPDYLPWLNQGILTAHNLEFDYSFLQTEYARLGIKFMRPEIEQLCTVKLSRLLLADLPSRSLPDLVQHFQFQIGRSHRAEADTLACWLLTERLFKELLEQDDAVLLARLGREWLSLKEAAKLLNQPPTVVQSELETAGAESRFVGQGRRGTWMYRRAAVEQLGQPQ
jgi:DNA polymerase-3 subunit epsilon